MALQKWTETEKKKQKKPGVIISVCKIQTSIDVLVLAQREPILKIYYIQIR